MAKKNNKELPPFIKDWMQAATPRPGRPYSPKTVFSVMMSRAEQVVAERARAAEETP